MGGGASKPEPAVKGDGVTTVDNSFSVVNIHTTTVVYMSVIVVFIVALIILVYIYFKRGGLHCCLEQAQPAHQLPIYRLPAPAPRRFSYAYGDAKPGSVVEMIRMEDGSEAMVRTFAVGEGKPRQSAMISTLLQPMKGMDEA